MREINSSLSSSIEASLVAALQQLLIVHFQFFYKFKFLHCDNFCSQLNDKLSPFYQYVHTLTVINYLAPPIILSFSGARACVELCWYKEARSWLHMGLTVSFNECFKRDTRCNANNISRKINTFQADSSTHNASDVPL